MSTTADAEVCESNGCEAKAAVRYYWPGQSVKLACMEHAAKLVTVSGAMGFHLVVQPLTVSDEHEAGY